jgi:riboflavin synthase
MSANGRFDGHIVQGHVDTTAVCTKADDLNGSWVFEFEHQVDDQYITVEKGSITINGVSLTVVKANANNFTVHIIPYTFDHTNFKDFIVGSVVNLEFDVIGKYVSRILRK